MSIETSPNINCREKVPDSTAGQPSPGFLLPSFGHPTEASLGLHQSPTQSVPPSNMN